LGGEEKSQTQQLEVQMLLYPFKTDELEMYQCTLLFSQYREGGQQV
jgi:hypothetical protein